jgi:Zn-dependent protease
MSDLWPQSPLVRETSHFRNPPPRRGKRKKKWLVGLGVLGAVLLKSKALYPALKFFPILLKTGGSMFLYLWIYAMSFGWWFAGGFVLLLLIHECGHLLAAKRVGLAVGAPVFIPFMGAFIALKEAPRNAWIEAQVGIGGPLLGTLGAVVCYGLYWVTHNPLFMGLAYVGFMLNLFNLAPVGILDGGRVVTALSPWLWVGGLAIIGWLLVHDLLVNGQLHFLLVLIVLFSLPRVISLFRRKTDTEARYFEVSFEQRWIMGCLYFGLVAFLFVGMRLTTGAGR